MQVLVNRFKQLTFLSIALTAFITGCSNGNNNGGAGGTLENPEPPTSGDWELVWSDEFEGSSLDLANWDIQLGDGSSEGVPGWGNNELQYYTADNITVQGGNLVITARTGDSPDANFDYTSARIRSTQGFTFGRIEASIQVPEGLGLWSAFWMLGTNMSPYGAWAARGEIDIMESFGQANPFAQAALHYGMQFPLNESVFKVAPEIDPTDGFHQYAVEWDVLQIRFFVDGVNYYTVKAESYWNVFFTDRDEGFLIGGSAAPFDAAQNIILNMAVGGNPAGTPDSSDTDVFPGEMLVEYVRVYECPIDPQNTGLGCADSIDPVDPFLITIDGDGTAPPQEPFIAVYPLYIDAPGVLFEDTSSERRLDIGVFDNMGALTITEVESADTDRGTVIDVVTTGGGNIQFLDAEDGESFELIGMGSAGDSAFYGGQLSFDVYVFGGAETDSGGTLQIKMDSGFPDIGFVEVPLSEIPTDEWVTLYFRISEVINGNIGSAGGAALDITEILNLIVLEPTGAAHMQFDNIFLACAAPESRPCGIVSVATIPQEVYIDAVDPAWDLGIGAADSGSGFVSYFDGSNPGSTNKIQWQEIADADMARGQVIEVTFNDSAETGVFFIQASDGVNLAAYAEGEVVFDIIVDDYGSNTDGITMKVDCTFPCTSGDQPLGVVADGVWETIRVPLAQLVNDGLDAAAVNTGLVIFPTSQNGGITFRIDNIFWEPTTDIVVGPRPPIAYNSDFEDLDSGAGLIGDDWTSFANVFDAAGTGFLYNYGPFPSPNGTGGFSNIATGEGGGDPAFGDQHLEIISDYNNRDAHTMAQVLEASTFQEYTILADDNGLFRLSFDVKAPATGGLVAPSTAKAYIQTIDPNNGFSISSNSEVDLSAVDSSAWVSFSIDLAVDGSVQEGQTLQFGFSSRATNDEGSSLLYDNVVFENTGAAPSGISYTQDFEGLDIANAAALGTTGDGYQVFNTTLFGATVVYSYGPFTAPNGGQGFSAIATGEGGVDQGAQYINIYSDYGNADHSNAALDHETSVFQEFTLGADDLGIYTFTFDAKVPSMNGIDPSRVSSLAFIQTLDPNAGFNTTNTITEDMTNISSTDWNTFSIQLDLTDPLLVGQLLQFGWRTIGGEFADSGIYYDNISFSR